MSQQKTYILLEVTHIKDISHLADMVAGRAYTIDGVRDVQIVTPGSPAELKHAGFSLSEIALGHGEVHRS